MQRELTFGYSPCPNDTFMFHAIAAGHETVAGCRLRPVLHDVERLNALAMEQVLAVTKLSFYALLAVGEHYQLLSSGAAMGFGCGPLVIARKAMAPEAIGGCRIALPGRWTTAHLLLRLFAPEAKERLFVPYDRIFQTLASGQADCGVIIHESRFTFGAAGFVPIVDLGAWWEARTGLPIPLGGIAAKRSLGEELIGQAEAAIGRSIRRAQDDPRAPLAYMRQHAQEMEAEVLDAHVKTFVNEYSLQLPDTGRQAIATLERLARQAGALP